MDDSDVNNIKRRLEMTEKTLHELEGIEFSTRFVFDMRDHAVAALLLILADMRFGVC